jgi:hypothetical protein
VPLLELSPMPSPDPAQRRAGRRHKWRLLAEPAVSNGDSEARTVSEAWTGRKLPESEPGEQNH